ncbi:MAG: M1 family metallopeptidase [Crocinitomicaceae bacterium]|nr:M1 family metallopeptidase [Crocinitomicaceae bacterium]
MRKVVIYSAVFLLAACGANKGNPSNKGEGGTSTNNSTEGSLGEEFVLQERPVYNPSETQLTDLIHTKLEVNFDWKQSRMNGVVTITAKPHFYATQELILDAKGMDINSVAMGGEVVEFAYIEDVLNIQLNKEYTRDQEYTVVIDYVSKPDERTTGGSAAITSDKGLYFINPLGEDKDVMPQIWTQGETESSSVWFPTIDSPNAKTTQEIFITVEDKFITLSNGALISSKPIEGGKRVDHWKQVLPHAPYLFMMGVGEFKVVKDSYTKKDGSTMEVNYIVEPEWEGSAKAIFGETPEMIRFFSELLGVEYPWDKYTQIVVRDYVSGAMENTGAVIFGDYAYKTERELLDDNDQSTIAHELFHHWFGDLVTAESWSNLTLNESFANYSQFLWDEHRYGVDEADYFGDQEADGYRQSASVQGYHDLVWFDYEDKDQMFDGHSYNKGGRILHMLRNYLGDDAFFSSLNRYLVDNQYQAAEFHELRLAFEEVTGEDLNWFFNQWYLGSGHATLVFTQEEDRKNHKLLVSVEQKQSLELSPIFKIPFQIAIFDDNGKHIHEVVIDELTEEFELPYTGTLKTFIYDYQQVLLADMEVMKSQSEYINEFYLGERYAARKQGLMEGTVGFSPKGQEMILDGLKDKFWHIRVLALGKAYMLDGEYAEKGLEIVKGMVKYDPKSDVRVAAVTAIGQLVDDETLLTTIYNDRVKEDRSYSVIAIALSNLSGINPTEALRIAETLENDESSAIIYGISQIYAAHGGPEKLAFMKKALEGDVVGGFDRLGVMNSLTIFIGRHDVSIAEQAYDIYVHLSENGGFYMKMFLPKAIGYLDQYFTETIENLEGELKVHEENKDVLYADQTRTKIKAYEAQQEKYRAFNKMLEKESNDGH